MPFTGKLMTLEIIKWNKSDSYDNDIIFPHLQSINLKPYICVLLQMCIFIVVDM